jgi:branched-chain amino acid transport system ATP-binding protein
MSGVILETRALSKHFGGLKAVDSVDMSVREGTIHGIIGPNGAGKTTFFNLLTGLIEVTRGSVLFAGRDITGVPPECVAGIGMSRTFQNIKLFRFMTVLDNVKVGFHTRTKTGLLGAVARNAAFRADEAFVTEQGLELLDFVGLRKQAYNLAANLSYGTQRRLEIARALATDPKVLLLDEPAAGMNPSEKSEVMELIRKISSLGRTIVVIEHDMKLIMNLCDVITVLNQGLKICEGTPAEVRNDPDVISAYLGHARGA